MESWIVTSWGAAVMVLASAVGIYASLMVLTRMMGLRSFSKLSSFDFAITVAIGSLREANVLRLSEVRAVVMESTGDVSVLHADPEEADVDPDLLQGVVGADGR